MKYIVQVLTVAGDKISLPAANRDAAMTAAMQAERNGLTQTFSDGFKRVPSSQIVSITGMEVPSDEEGTAVPNTDEPVAEKVAPQPAPKKKAAGKKTARSVSPRKGK